MKITILATEPDADGVKHPAGIRIRNLPKNGLQRIPMDTIERHKDYVTIDADGIAFKTVEGVVNFPIIRPPGRYCLTCNERLPDHGGNGTVVEASRAAECLSHVAAHGKKAETSDAWAHGYVNYPRTFECSIEDKR